MATAPQKQHSPLLLSAMDKKRVRKEVITDSIVAGVVFALVLTVVQRVVGFGRGVLFCRFMTDQQLGQWSMVWSYLMLLAPLSVLGLPGCFGKFTEYFRQRGQFQTFIVRIGLISLAMALLVSGFIFAFPEIVSQVLFRDPTQTTLVRGLALCLTVVTASNFLCSLLESLRQVRAVTLMRLITGITFAIIGTGLLMGWHGSATAATIGFAISSMAGLVPAIWVLRKYRSGIFMEDTPLTHRDMWSRIGPYAIWLWACNLLNNLFEVSDRFMLLQWSDISADLAQASVGQYHSGRVIPLVFVSIAGVLAGVLLPYMSQAWESDKKSQVTKQSNATIKLVSLSFTLGGTLALLVAPLLFNIILQGRYDSGLGVLPLTLVYCIWFSLMTVGQNYLWVAEKGKWAVLAVGIGLVANLGLNMVLIPVYGLSGVVLATAIGNLVIVILIFALNHHLGCKTDLGIWLSAAFPLMLLLPKPLMVVAVVTTGLLCWTSSLVFSADEKDSVRKLFHEKIGSRLKLRK